LKTNARCESKDFWDGGARNKNRLTRQAHKAKNPVVSKFERQGQRTVLSGCRSAASLPLTHLPKILRPAAYRIGEAQNNPVADNLQFGLKWGRAAST
jgi:hypothetical protein